MTSSYKITTVGCAAGNHRLEIEMSELLSGADLIDEFRKAMLMMGYSMGTVIDLLPEVEEHEPYDDHEL